MPFQPNDISGCLAWFTAASITGVVNGGSFSSWNDSSGSGNNLKFTSNSSFPKYLTNQLNGYPVVNMPGPNGANGANNFFQFNASGTNNGLDGISPSSLSIYCVYQTNSNSGQTLISLSTTSGISNANLSAFSLDLNVAATGSPSASNSWFFSYESGTNLNYVVQATGFKQSTNYVLRTDRFTPYSITGIHFQFGVNGINTVATSNPVFNSLKDTNAFLLLGASYYNFSNIFNGNIAEVLLYSSNPPLSDQQDSQITNYLLSKYNLNNYGATSLFMNAPPIAFTPSGLSNLFAWYEAANSVTGVAPGGNITSLLDLSGSGNNMVMGSGTPPIYATNAINGFPTIRFSGGFLFTPTHSQSLEVNNSGLSIYSVYRTNNPTSQQSILVNEGVDPSKKRDWRNFSIGINNNNNFGTAPSSWFYSWGLVQASLPITEYVSTTNIFQPVSKYVIRGDLFSSSGFFFCNFNNLTPASSTTVNTYSGANSLLYMGYSQYDNSMYLNGDVAEILVFNSNTLSTYVSPPYFGQTNLHNIIVDYLNDKYFNPSGINNSISLFTSGVAASTVNNEIPLYISSISTLTDSTSLFTSGNTIAPISDNTTLYIGSTMGQTVPKTLFVGAGSFNSGGFPLYTINIPSGFVSLYIGAGSVNNGEIPLFIGNNSMQYSNFPLYVQGFMSGGQSTTLWTQGNLQQYPPMDLYTKGQQVGVDSIDLFIGHTNSINGGIPLYVNTGAENFSGIPPYYITTYVKGQPVPSGIGNIPLFMATTNIIGGSGLYNDSPLYTIGGPSGYQTALPLFLGNNLREPFPPSGGMPLFVSGPIYSGTSHENTTLFVGNYTQQINSQGYQGKLYTRGAGTLNGGLIYQESMPLFLGVGPFVSAIVLPTYFNSDYFGLQDFNFNYFSPASPSAPQGPSGLSVGTTMFMFGTFSDFGGINMYTQGLVNSGNVPLFIQAPLSISKGIDMVISGTPIVNQSMTLYGAGF